MMKYVSQHGLKVHWHEQLNSDKLLKWIKTTEIKKWIMQFHDKTQGNKQVMNWKERINEFDLKSLKRQGVWIEEGVLTWSRTLSREIFKSMWSLKWSITLWRIALKYRWICSKYVCTYRAKRIIEKIDFVSVTSKLKEHIEKLGPIRVNALWVFLCYWVLM